MPERSYSAQLLAQLVKCGVGVACVPTMQALSQHRLFLAKRSSPNEEAQKVGILLTRLARAARITERVVEQPPFWGGVATALAVKGGTRGRRAALRGSVCYVVAAFIANIVIKPLVGRRRPQGAGEGRIGPFTSSFPSGHTASDSAFVFSVAQELPLLAIPLAAAATAAHWSLIRSRKHHLSDVLGGGAIGLGVTYIVWKSWPTETSSLVRWATGGAVATVSVGEARGRGY